MVEAVELVVNVYFGFVSSIISMNMALMRSDKDQGMCVHMLLFHFLTRTRRFQSQGKLRVLDTYLKVIFLV